MLLVLAEGAHRWESVWIEGPGEIIEVVSLVEGKLQLLSKLVLRLATPPDQREFRVDCFASAPLLRHVDLSASIENRGPQQAEGIFYISLPWSQLEKYKASTPRDTSYPKLFQHSQQSLIKLQCRTNQLPALNSISEANFSRLKKLYLMQYYGATQIQPADVLLHLGQLTLPSLTHLKVYDFLFTPTDPLYEIVINLIQRSGCSLKSLRLHSNVAPESVEQFVSLLELCPELEFMDVRTPTENMLQKLWLDRTSPAPIVPKLKTLVLRAPSGSVWEVPRDRVFVDPLNFMRVVRSRTQDLLNSDQPITGGQTFHCLEEVRIIVHLGDSSTFYQQLALFEGAALPPFDIKPENSVLRVGRRTVLVWVNVLQRNFCGRWHSTAEYRDVKMHWEMNRLMKELEELKIGPGDGLMLCVSTIVTFKSGVRVACVVIKLTFFAR
ncbi:hypothetical protein H1R20_g9326, partial [Candolleomyces eurysporus]